MNKQLYKYIDDKKRLLEYFNCPEDYDIRVCTSFKWKISFDEDINILSYWKEGGGKVDAVVTRKDGQPLIYETDDLTLVVGIDCIKIAFIMKNTYRE